MQYKASLIAALSFSASAFAAPSLNVPVVPSVLSETPAAPISNVALPRDAQNLASPFSDANGNVANVGAIKNKKPVRDFAGLAEVKNVAPITNLANVDANVVTPVINDKRTVLAITDVVTSVHSCKTTVVSDVSSIHALISSVGTTAAGQQGLAQEIIADLGDIVNALTITVNGVLAQTLPAVVDIVLTEVADVLAIVSDVELIVFQLVHVLEALVAGLLDSTLQLVDAELLEVYKLLSPVLTPVLKFIGLVQCNGDAGLLPEVTAAVGGILLSVNGLLSDKGLEVIEL